MFTTAVPFVFAVFAVAGGVVGVQARAARQAVAASAAFRAAVPATTGPFSGFAREAA